MTERSDRTQAITAKHLCFANYCAAQVPEFRVECDGANRAVPRTPLRPLILRPMLQREVAAVRRQVCVSPICGDVSAEQTDLLLLPNDVSSFASALAALLRSPGKRLLYPESLRTRYIAGLGDPVNQSNQVPRP